MLEDPNDNTRSNTETAESTTRSNTEVGMPATGVNEITTMDTTRRNNQVLIENPFETEGDDDETPGTRTSKDGENTSQRNNPILGKSSNSSPE